LLNLSGNSEQAFAKLNSINANPVTWIEWNYNAITKPYVVSSTSANPVSTNMNIAAFWVNQNGGNAQDYTSGGYITETSSNSGKAVLLSLPPKGFEEIFSQTISIALANGYYKIIFYVKSDQVNTTGMPLPIDKTTVSFSGVNIGSGQNKYYQIVPVSSTKESYMFDATGNNAASVQINSTSVTINWPKVSQATHYDIYYGTSPAVMPHLTSIPNHRTTLNSSNLHFYTHDFSITPTRWSPAPSITSKFYITPAVRLSAGGNYLEDTRFFCRVYDEYSPDPISMDNLIELETSKYYKVELFFGSDTAFDNIEVDIPLTGTSVGIGMLLSKAEMFKMDSWNFYNWQYFPIESPFTPSRPGEALLHPYLPSADKTMFDGANTIYKPVSSVFYHHKFYTEPYRPYIQLKNSIFNKYKYYIADSSYTNPTLRAQYDRYLDINKIVVKASNAVVNMSNVSGSIQLLGPNNTIINTLQFNAGAFNNHGIMTFYYDGSAWSSTRGSWVPPELTDSGILQNVTSSVTGIVYIQNKPDTINGALANRYNDVLNGQPINSGVTKNILDTHIIEISPRLEIDVSELTKSVKVTKTMDDESSAAGFPIGFFNANSGNVELSNIPVYKNSFPHTIFETLSDTSTFSDLIREGTKFTVGLVSPTNDFTDYVPFLTMYADSWDISGLDTISVNLFDTAKYQLMASEGLEYFCAKENVFDTVVNLLEISGMSDYDYSNLYSILKRNSRHMDHFWSDRKETMHNALKDLFVANQIGASFDEYGILRFYDLDKYIYSQTNNSFTPDFAVTDQPLTIAKSSSSINYESNIIQNSYSPTIDKKIGKVTINYKVPQTHMSDDSQAGNFDKAKRTVATAAVFQESGTIGLIASWGNRSVLNNQNWMETDPHLSVGRTGVKHNIGFTNGNAFLQGELISWRGLEWKFSANNPTKMQPFYKVLFNSSEIDDTVRHAQTVANVGSIFYEFTGLLAGLGRGERYTSVRDHLLYHDGAAIRGYYNSTNSALSQYFVKKAITGVGYGQRTSIPSSAGGITFNHNIANFVTPKSSTQYPLVLIPKATTRKGKYQVPVNASNFDYFTFVFAAPNYKNTKFTHGETNTTEFGLYINHPVAPFMVGIRGVVENQKNKSKLAVNKYSTGTFTPYNGTSKNSNYSVPFVDSPVDVFDGKYHRMTFHINWKNGKVHMFVDQKYAGVGVVSAPRNKSFNHSAADEWGFYVENLTKNSASTAPNITVNLQEMYALALTDESIFTFINDHKNTYHWQMKEFLNKIMKNDPLAEPTYFYWGPNILTGAYFYDQVEFDSKESKPVLEGTAKENFVGYSANTVAGNNQVLLNTVKTDVSFSDIYYNPFRFSLAAVNNSGGTDQKSKQVVYLSSQDGNISQGKIENFAINAHFFKSSEEKTLERIIDNANINQSATLTSNWIQNTAHAQNLMKKIMIMINSFNQTISIQIFGNPLIQVGDICQFVYTLKKIGYDPEGQGVIPKYFIVKEVSQEFTGGLVTNLVIKPLFNMNYQIIQ
jgi:hypothetical protein